MSVPFALLSGAFGAAASCLAKFAFSSDTFLAAWTLQTCEAAATTTTTTAALSSVPKTCEIVVIFVRGLCFVGTLALNIFMVGSFLEGMEESGSIAGTALASAANFCVSSMLGFLLWDETFSSTWLFGFSLVILGTMLLSTVKASPPASAERSSGDDDEKKKKE